MKSPEKVLLARAERRRRGRRDTVNLVSEADSITRSHSVADRRLCSWYLLAAAWNALSLRHDVDEEPAEPIALLARPLKRVGRRARHLTHVLGDRLALSPACTLVTCRRGLVTNCHLCCQSRSSALCKLTLHVELPICTVASTHANSV